MLLPIIVHYAYGHPNSSYVRTQPYAGNPPSLPSVIEIKSVYQPYLKQVFSFLAMRCESAADGQPQAEGPGPGTQG